MRQIFEFSSDSGNTAEKLHEETYRDFGFELLSVERGSLAQRVSIIKEQFFS
jgi:predicted ATPase